MRRLPPKRTLLYALLGLLVAFLGYRMVRPMNIFVVSDAFERPIPVTSPPRGLRSLSASECAQCHTGIYEEWSASVHAQAWIDPYFQVDFAFDGSQQICRNCHTPLQNQQEHLVVGFRDREKFKPVLVPNEAFDPDLQAEGVTCAVCHVRGETVIGPYGDTRAPHATRRDPAMADGFGACTRCHVVSGNRWDTFYRIPPCGTVAEISKGGTTIDCTGCHMPAVVRPVWNGGVPRPGRKHLWKGGHDPLMVRRAVDVDLDVGAGGATGRKVILTLTNVGTDHYFPTGTPDRHLTVDFRLKSAAGKVLKSQRHVLKRTILWRPFIVDLWDTRLRKGEPRAYHFDVPMDSEPPPTLLHVVVRYHLLDEARRRRIGYRNQEPIDSVIYETEVPLE